MKGRHSAIEKARLAWGPACASEKDYLLCLAEEIMKTNCAERSGSEPGSGQEAEELEGSIASPAEAERRNRRGLQRQETSRLNRATWAHVTSPQARNLAGLVS
jgi:hypothetical protein